MQVITGELMEIIFQGKHTENEAIESLSSVIKLFKDRYHINQFREMHLVVTLVDRNGQDVELVDGETEQVYRYFEVYREGETVKPNKSKNAALKLVIDNTRENNPRP